MYKYIYSSSSTCIHVVEFQLIFISTAYCPNEITHLLQGNYNWSETEAELMETFECMHGGLGSHGECDVVDLVNASRSCNELGRWEEPDVSNCLSQVTVMLCDIRNVSNGVAVTTHAHKHMYLSASHHVQYLLMLLQMGVTNPESTLNGIEMALSMANDAGDRSSTNLNTVTNALQIVAENSSISVSTDVLESATSILSTIQDWGRDNTTLAILQNSSAECVMLADKIFSTTDV